MNEEPQILCHFAVDKGAPCSQTGEINHLKQILREHESRIVSLESKRRRYKYGNTITSNTLLHVRSRLGLTQAELGRLLGVHVMSVSRWERNDPPSRQYILDRISLLRTMDRRQVKDLLLQKIPIPLPEDGDVF